MKELPAASGLGAAIATWSPNVQALAVVAVVTVLLAKSDKPTKRSIALIRGTQESVDMTADLISETSRPATS